MARRMGYYATLDWLIDNDDLSDVLHRDDDPILTIACSLAADIFGKTDDQLRTDLHNRIGHRESVKNRHGWATEIR